MKIERISENQIRCTLSHQDLADRELKISELAYGTEKAKALFRDMMQQASFEFGFEAEDIPIMIEAIPISKDKLVLIITKVEDPDELDTRFSKFSHDEASEDDDPFDDPENLAEQLFNHFNELSDFVHPDDEAYEDFDANDEPLPFGEPSTKKSDVKPESKPVSELVKTYSFATLDDVTNFSVNVANLYDGTNSVYKNNITSRYFLIMKNNSQLPEDFSKVCNLASEFGRAERSNYATASHCKEHYDIIIKDKAIQVLASL